MEIDRVNPEIFGVNIREWPVEAAESRLFLGQDPSGNRLAIKVYPNLTIRQIQTYAEVTNQLAGLVNGSGVTVTLEVQGNANSYSVYITPISILGVVADPDQSDRDIPCTISPFIDGETLFDLDRRYLSGQWSFSTSQNSLKVLSLGLKRVSGRQGISIISWNVKPLEIEDQPILVVTDVCGSIKSLR
ncbi:hypothetical protein A2210_02875 [Candidatus Woesebacteria bacterium RIFOXYA1_FULL_40_18]|nr:MAG: hypothetical protein A2210_02875 [Candidatus Woesebacteria bacterium RIFOXYA1_FULL_40_18]